MTPAEIHTERMLDARSAANAAGRQPDPACPGTPTDPCGEAMEWEDAHPADRKTGEPAWRGGYCCGVCGCAVEARAYDDDDDRFEEARELDSAQPPPSHAPHSETVA